MNKRIFVGIIFTALSAAACSAPPNGGETQGATTDEAIIRPCPLDSAFPCPPPPPPVVTVYGTWTRSAAGIRPSETLRETLELKTDNTYSLTEVSGPVCPPGKFCPLYVSLFEHTEGSFDVSGPVITLHPVTPDARLPERFDIIRRFPPPVGGPPVADVPPAADAPPADGIAPIAYPFPIALHAIEQGKDVYLSRPIPPPPGPQPL